MSECRFQCIPSKINTGYSDTVADVLNGRRIEHFKVCLNSLTRDTCFYQMCVFIDILGSVPVMCFRWFFETDSEMEVNN